jgi:hypothetical protein
MAGLCACYLFSETEAATSLGFSPKSWFSWKGRNRNSEGFAGILARMRTEQIKAHVENIQAAEVGKSGHRPDWRASAFLLGKKAPATFGESPQVEVNVGVRVQTEQQKAQMHEFIESLYAKRKELDGQHPAQIALMNRTPGEVLIDAANAACPLDALKPAVLTPRD